MNPVEKLLVGYNAGDIWTPNDPAEFAFFSRDMVHALLQEHDVLSGQHKTPKVPFAAGLVAVGGGVYTSLVLVNSVGNPNKIATGQIRITLSAGFHSADEWMLVAWPDWSSAAHGIGVCELGDVAASAPRTATQSEILFVNEAGTAVDPAGIVLWLAYGVY